MIMNEHDNTLDLEFESVSVDIDEYCVFNDIDDYDLFGERMIQDENYDMSDDDISFE